MNGDLQMFIDYKSESFLLFLLYGVFYGCQTPVFVLKIKLVMMHELLSGLPLIQCNTSVTHAFTLHSKHAFLQHNLFLFGLSREILQYI